ncbi:MAG: bifunctional UDP-N-acetylglucosamine diphosphorylase/glucosamine-1-phosphate N-acetyltransferase GlmU, partial [Oscillospiraceae bacterium]|nr:bifunctional UDP-N-acetylglucosamine diphosphorylase/glucosamine-1-phosphate N-acetyltransferase GlmU [Oscillospiraceae bacterium]
MKNAVILAGGQGKRMRADIPKPMFKILGEPMLEWIIGTCRDSGAENICVVTGYMSEYIDAYLREKEHTDIRTVKQQQQLGTAHAVLQAADGLDGEYTLVVCGDAPLLDSETVRNAFDMHTENNAAVTVITAEIDNPKGYGRIVRTADGIKAIVEENDADSSEKLIKEVNSGAYWFKTPDLLFALNTIGAGSGEEYKLTDCIAALLEAGKTAQAYMSGNPNAVLGANDRKDLLKMNGIARITVIEKHLEQGVDFQCTDGITIERRVKIGENTVIKPGTVLTGNTVIGENCIIGPNTVIDSCTVGGSSELNSVQAADSVIESGVKIGPFVRIRPDCHIRNNVKIGNFVEVKNSDIGEFTSIAHLTYIGDSDVGRRVNFGCGCVTVNYDGIKKSRCKIGDNCFIGCNTNLIAPVTLGKAV